MNNKKKRSGTRFSTYLMNTKINGETWKSCFSTNPEKEIREKEATLRTQITSNITKFICKINGIVGQTRNFVLQIFDWTRLISAANQRIGENEGIVFPTYKMRRIKITDMSIFRHEPEIMQELSSLEARLETAARWKRNVSGVWSAFCMFDIWCFLWWLVGGRRWCNVKNWMLLLLQELLFFEKYPAAWISRSDYITW